ncbi:RING-H2 finger protein ATL48 [Camellia lanceoleosa]|uniref:RING-H2 finger protein ATL48 n=1 Tax=Camellia lanceoleosa TaxID=1840588 RepID=A0ACC0ILM8_9ERIC|nr:RING-H2 finger protein ATL48 [Camellia lanceoleosa]
MEFFTFGLWLFMGTTLITAHAYAFWKVCNREPNDNGSDVVDSKKLPCFEYKVEEKSNGPEMDCAVCLESFKKGDLCKLLPICKHTFHAQCIDSWLIKTPNCPICRTCANSK